MQELVHIAVRGRLGTYQVRIFDAGDPPLQTFPIKTSLFGDLTIRYGGGGDELRSGLLKSLVELTLDDPKGEIRSLFEVPFAPSRFPAEITGPLTGSERMTWRGIVTTGQRKRPISDRLQRGRFQIRLICSLALMEDLDAPVDSQFASAAVKLHWYFPNGFAEPPSFASGLQLWSENGRWTGIDEWSQTYIPKSAEDPIPYISALTTPLIWMSLQGRFWWVERPLIGTELTLYDLSTGLSETISPKYAQISEQDILGAKEATRETVEEGGGVIYELDDDYNLMPPVRQAQEGTDFTRPAGWALTGQATAREDFDPPAILVGALQATGESTLLTRRIITITPQDFLQARLTWSLETWQDANAEADVEVRLVTIDKTGTETVVAADGLTESEVTTNTFNGPTTIRVEAEGRGGDWRDVRLQFVRFGRIVTRLEFAEDGAWLPIELDLLEGPDAPSAEPLIRLATPATRYRNDGGTAYHSLAAYLAADRIRQQRPGTERIRATLQGLYPPEVRLTWPWGVESLASGKRVLNLSKGTTDVNEVTI